MSGRGTGERRTVGDWFIGVTFIACALLVFAVLPLALSRREPWFLIVLVGWGGLAMLALGLSTLRLFRARGDQVAIGIVFALLLGMGVAMLLSPEQMTTTGVRGPRTPAAALDIGFLVVGLFAVMAVWWGWQRLRREGDDRPPAVALLALIWVVMAGAHLWLTWQPGLSVGWRVVAVVGSIGWSALPVLMISAIWKSRLTPVLAAAFALFLIVNGVAEARWAPELMDPAQRWPANSVGALVGRGVVMAAAGTGIGVWLVLRGLRSREPVDARTGG